MVSATSVMIRLLSPTRSAKFALTRASRNPTLLSPTERDKNPPMPTWSVFVRLAMPLETKGGLDRILKVDAHHTKLISTAILLSNSRQKSNRNGRSEKPQGEMTQHGA